MDASGFLQLIVSPQGWSLAISLKREHDKRLEEMLSIHRWDFYCWSQRQEPDEVLGRGGYGVKERRVELEVGLKWGMFQGTNNLTWKLLVLHFLLKFFGNLFLPGRMGSVWITCRIWALKFSPQVLGQVQKWQKPTQEKTFIVNQVTLCNHLSSEKGGVPDRRM